MKISSMQKVTVRTRSGGLTPAAQQAVILRSRGMKWREVAAELGCPETSCKNWTVDPAFRAALDTLLEAGRVDAVTFLQANLVAAAETVVAVMQTGRAKRDEPRLAAAQDILDRFGVGTAESGPAPIPNNVSAAIIDFAERAFIAALRSQPAPVGGALLPGQPPDAGDDSLRTIPVSSRVLDGPE